MRIHRVLFITLMAFIALPALPQGGKVVVEGVATKELKRTARRMRIPVEQLKNARAALQEATDLVPHLKAPRRRQAVSPASLGMLGNLWIQINKPKAPAALEGLVTNARMSAASAPDLPTYSYFSNRASMLLSSYSQLEPDKALEIARQWPNPPASSGEMGSRMRENLQKQFQRMVLQGMATQDPQRALALRAEAGGDVPSDYGFESQAITQLIADGKKEQALKLVDQTIDDFRRQGNPANLGSFSYFVRQLASVDPDRFVTAFQLLGKPNVDTPQPGMPALSGSMQINGQTIPMPASQAMRLNLLRNIQNRPGLLMKTLDSQPDLKSLVESHGGIDDFFSPESGPTVISYTTGYAGSTFGYRSGPNSTLLQQLKGKAAKDPGTVRRRLAEVYDNPEKVQELISLAMIAAYQDPDLSQIALEIAEPMVSGIELLQKRCAAFENLVRAYSNLDGEVSPNLLREGFVLADRLREQEKTPEVGMPMMVRMGSGSADRLENFLLGQAARQSLQSALDFVRGMSDDGHKVAALLQIAQSLTQNY